ncbi:hypothetical protein KJI95_04195 [Shewanella sp. JM162201]|uniref:Solute-binding protein family 3/N-terminal domain-containing protein n=1 Tax=Shewanella jiangmenensis TaxID=2837387 RepID=A0ABS5V1R3_9GAMM|nr:hypothetical protein [Shewanella jiangmenensis]MBT1443726.1 hypothetical protein [Shewanella jiangmenensis]
MARNHSFYGIILLLACLCSSAMGENKPLIFISARNDTNAGYLWLKLVYDEAFRRLGRQYQVETFPDKRGELLLSQGEVDGDLARSEQFIERNPSLILVPVAVAWTNFTAFSVKEGLKLQRWEDLTADNLKVEYRRGAALAESRLVAIIKPENLSIANDWETGIRKLLAGRTDVYVDAEVDVLSLLASGAFPEGQVKVAGVLEKVDGYPVLHPKNADLAKPLEAVLRSMADEGLIEVYRLQAMAQASRVQSSKP